MRSYVLPLWLCRKSIVSTILCLYFGFLPTAEAADAEFGVWDFVSGMGSRGTPLCGISSQVTNLGIGQNIIIKGFRGKSTLTIDLYKDTWARPTGSTINVMFDFLDNKPFKASAYADGHILDIELPTEYIGIFLVKLAKEPALEVIFPDEQEATWFIKGANAFDEVKRLTACLKEFAEPE